MISFLPINVTSCPYNVLQQLQHSFCMARTGLPVRDVFGTDSLVFYRTEQNILRSTFHCILSTILSCITNFIHSRQYKYHLGQICFLGMPYHKWQMVFCFWLRSMYGGISTYSTIVSSSNVRLE